MKKTLFIANRITLGLFVMIGVAFVLHFVPRPPLGSYYIDEFFSFHPLHTAWGALNGALAAFAGAYIARVNFSGVAVLTLTAIFLYAGRILHTIAGAFDHTS